MKTDIKIREEQSEFVITLSFEGTRTVSFSHALKRPVRYEDLLEVLETIIDSTRDATERGVQHEIELLLKRRECRECGKFKHRSDGRYIGKDFICKECETWYLKQFGDA